MHRYPKSHLKAALFLAISLAIVINALPARESDGMTSIPVSLSVTLDSGSTQRANPTFAPPKLDDEPIRKESTAKKIRIRPGDSLSSIFNRAGLSATELHNIMSLGRDVAVLGKIQPGQSIQFDVDENGSIKRLRYEESRLKKLTVSRNDTGFSAEWNQLEPEILISYKTAKITETDPSLYHAGKSSGLSDKLIMQLSYIFQWDISFALDLRLGDTFTLMYEDVYVEGEKIEQGKILAAQFNNLGKTYTAVLYDDGKGHSNYFTPDGRSLRKAFLRDPVHFSHVSSRFNLKRLHPIHKQVMPHRGIDYAANRGTPVVASGDGKVTIARKNSASGRYIVLRHGEQYATKYLHLSAFAKGVRAGKSVKQGQTIGYVGATGWATAPHLHYEFLVNGVHRNPRTVTLPKAQPIDRANLKKFKRLTRPVLARLQSVAGATGYAMAKLD